MSRHKHSYIDKGGLLVPPGEIIVHRRQGLPSEIPVKTTSLEPFFYYYFGMPAPQYTLFAPLILHKLLYWNLQSSLEHLKR